MYDPVFGGESGLGEVGVHKIDCVGDQRGLCFGVNNFEKTVAFKVRFDIEPVASLAIPRFSLGWFVVYYEAAAHRTHGSGGRVKGAVEILLCVHEYIER